MSFDSALSKTESTVVIHSAHTLMASSLARALAPVLPACDADGGRWWIVPPAFCVDDNFAVVVHVISDESGVGDACFAFVEES
jgi:hypothetical protein